MKPSKYFKITNLIYDLFIYLGIGWIIILSIMLFLESFVRLFWRLSLFTVDEIGGLGMYMFTVLNIGPLYRKNQHLTVDILVSKFSNSVQHILTIVLHLLTIIFASITTYLWWKFIFVPTFKNLRYLRMSHIVEWPFHLIAVVCWIVLIIAAVECLIIEVRNKSYLRILEGNK